MDFFRHQSEAHSRSRQLVCLFVLAIGLVVLTINCVGAGLWYLLAPTSELPDYFLATNTFIVVLYVIGGAWLEWTNLEKGGASIAHQLRARSPNRYDLRHKRLTNITEEIALAAGIPVPQVFVLDHESINALAAGHDPAHAAIVVTDGALQNLTRAELQGVVAHEVSHIINGDAALNTRLTGALYGLYSLHILGRDMLDVAWRTGTAGAGGRLRGLTGRSSLAGFIPFPLLGLLGALLCCVGWLGKISGHLVQAGISRQREFLADARAVQLTRSRDGIGGALRKIAGQEARGPLGAAYCQVVSHFWLSSDRPHRRWFDVHPPVITRVRRIYGRPLPPIRPELVQIVGEDPGGQIPALEPLPFNFGLEVASIGLNALAAGNYESGGEIKASSDVAAPALNADTKAELDYHEYPAASGPEARLLAIAREPGATLSGVALILNGIVVGPGHLSDEEESTNRELIDALFWLEQPEGQWLRVPLIELLTAQLRDWPSESRRTLVRYCHDAVLADGRIEKTEWVYFTLARHRLLPEQQTSGGTVTPLDKRKALAELFSMAATLSVCSARQVRDALVIAATHIGVPQPASTPDQLRFRSLTQALDVLCRLPPLKKPGLLRALERLEFGSTNAVYRAFMVAVAAAIDCPPLRPESTVQNGAGQPRESQMV